MLLSAPPAWHTPCHIITTCSLQPPDADTIHVCLSCQKSKIKILDRPAIQSNRNMKCEILEYAFIARCWLCDTDHCTGTEAPGMGHCHCWESEIPIILRMMHRDQCWQFAGLWLVSLNKHCPIIGWSSDGSCLHLVYTKEKMISSKNVWVDNIHECLGMKTRMAISQFYSDPVPRTRTWLFTRTRWITITGGAWH